MYNNRDTLTGSSFNPATTTVFIVHGFTDNGTVHINEYVPQGNWQGFEPSMTISRLKLGSFLYLAYLASALNYNYIVVDWGLLSGNAPFANEVEQLLIYTKVVTVNLLIVARRLKDFIKFVDVPTTSIHVVGHSLG